MTISLNNKSIRLLFISRTGMAVGGILAVTMASSLWRLRNFIEKELAPLAQENLTNTLKRPITLGDVKSFSLSGVRFGALTIPQTTTDSDRVTAEAVEVGFDPLQLLLNRRLKLDVTLVNPDVYIEQDKQGVWVDTSLNNLDQEGFIKTDLDKLRLRNGNLVLLPYRPKQGKIRNFLSSTSEPVEDFPGKKSQISLNFNRVNGIAQLSDDYQLIKFSVGADPALGGNIALEGEARPRTLAVNFNLKARDIFSSDITRLIPLPIEFQAGRVRGDLNIQWAPKKQPLLFGRADFKNLHLKVPQAPKAFVNSHGSVKFDGLKMNLRDVKTNYGKVPLLGKGVIHTVAGYDLKARIHGVSAKLAQKTIGFTLPIDTTGLLKADLKLRGKLHEPLLLGNVSTIKPAKVDKVDFKKVRGQFSFAPVSGLVRLKNLQGEAAVGGQVIGGGIIQLGEKPKVRLNFQAENFSGDAIAKIYDGAPPIRIGSVRAQAQVDGTPSSVRTTVRFRAPQATYPTSGEVIVAPDKSLSFREVKLAVAGGKVKVKGKWNDKGWEAIADADGVHVKPFANPDVLAKVSLHEAQLKGRLIITGKSSSFDVATIRSENARVNLAGGTVTIAKIDLKEQNFAAKLIADGVQLARLFKQAPPIGGASLAGSFQIAGSRQNLSLGSLRARGQARLNVAGGTVKARNIQLDKGLYRAKLLTKKLKLQQLAPQSPGQLRGLVNGEFDVAGSAESFDPSSIQATGKAQLNLPGGAIDAKDIQLRNGRYQANLQANKIPLEKLAPQLPRQCRGKLTGQFNLAGSLKSFELEAIQGKGEAHLDLGSGTVTASKIELVRGRYRTQIVTRNLPLQHFAPVPPQVQGALNGQFNVAGSLKSLQPENIRENIEVVGQAKLNVAGGEVNASNIQLTEGRYQAVVDATRVQLNQFNPELSGQFQSQLKLAGNLAQLNLAGVEAAGQVELSQGIPGINRPLEATVAWNGKKLNIEQAQAPGFSAKGYVLANTDTTGVPEITNLNLDINAQNYNLRSLPLNLPNVVKVTGKANFQGKVTGNLSIPNVQGQLSVQDLQVNQVAFEPLLSGNVKTVSGGGLNLSIAGQGDQIAFKLDGNNQPRSFLVRRQQALAAGELRGDHLAVKAEKIPLQLFNFTLPPTTAVGPGTVAGSLSGNFQVNRENFATKGNLTIDQPKIGRIKGDHLLADFSWDENKITLDNSSFLKENSKYAFTGSVTQSSQGPQLKGEINVTQGKAQDVLTAFQLFEIQDFQRGFEQPAYGKAADIANTQAVGLANGPLKMQLRRFSEIKQLLAQQKKRQLDASPFPKLADLQGTFDSNIKIDTATAKQPKVLFHFKGKDFAWGKKNQPGRFYNFQQIIAEGKFERGILKLRPLQI